MPEDRTRTAGLDRDAVAQTTITPPSPPGYELCERIGQGGMGVVFRARDAALDRDVAVKPLSEHYPPDSPAAHRFLSEARITGLLQHPSIPAVSLQHLEKRSRVRALSVSEGSSSLTLQARTRFHAHR